MLIHQVYPWKSEGNDEGELIIRVKRYIEGMMRQRRAVEVLSGTKVHLLIDNRSVCLHSVNAMALVLSIYYIHTAISIQEVHSSGERMFLRVAGGCRLHRSLCAAGLGSRRANAQRHVTGNFYVSHFTTT